MVVSFRAGFVAVVGRPNVGKSSLVNALVGTKVAIVSDKPQTTRHAVRGVMNGEGVQAVFVDTPGFHKPRTALGARLNERVEEAVGSGVDAVLLVVDGGAGVGRGDAFVAAREVAPFDGPKLCAVNKVDRLKGHTVVPQLDAAARLAPFDHVVPTSARMDLGVEELRDVIVDVLPEGVPLFPPDSSTDQSMELRISEVIREKALAATREELPHSIAVAVDELEPDEDAGLTRISALVYVERESQKGMVIGRGGEMLKRIGTEARREIEPLLGSRVFLELRVKILKEWQRDERAVDRLGY
jgi:GTP-binding protein Era